MAVDSAESEEPFELVDRVPRTDQERDRLLASGQAGWEYLLFAGRLRSRYDALRLRRRDHDLGLSSGPFRAVGADDLAGFVSERFAHMQWIIRELGRAMAGQEAAFGAPGTPGDAELIEHFADMVVRVYSRLLDWADGIRAVGVPDEFEATTELMSRAGDECMAGIDRFIADLVRDADRLPGLLASHEDGDSPLTIEVTLTLDADDDLLDEVVAGLRDAYAAQTEEAT